VALGNGLAVEAERASDLGCGQALTIPAVVDFGERLVVDRGRRGRARGSSPGSRVWRASGLGLRLCSLLCTEAASSSIGGADYVDRGRITFGSTCSCGGVPGPCVPSCEGSIIGQSRGVSALDGRAERAVVPAVLGSSILRAAPWQLSMFTPLGLVQN
jgi:hypothetical protein